MLAAQHSLTEPYFHLVQTGCEWCGCAGLNMVEVRWTVCVCVCEGLVQSLISLFSLQLHSDLVCPLSFPRSIHPLTLYPSIQTLPLTLSLLPPPLPPLPYDSSLVHSMRLSGCSSRSSQYAQLCTLASLLSLSPPSNSFISSLYVHIEYVQLFASNKSNNCMCTTHHIFRHVIDAYKGSAVWLRLKTPAFTTVY